MVIAIIARIFLPFVAISSSLIVTAIFSVAVYFFRTLQIDSIAGTTFGGIIVFLVAWILVVGIALYCTIIYEKLHRMFLLIVIISGCLGLGILSYTVLGISGALLDCVNVLFQGSHENAIENLERLFECEGFSIGDEGEETCAQTIKRWLDSSGKQLGTGFGISAIVYAVFAVGCVWLSCKIREMEVVGKEPREFGVGGEQSKQLKEGLNPGGVVSV
jgi:hypothetical protein